MIVKFLKNKGRGSITATLDYMLGKNRDRNKAKVLKGSPELTRQIAESLDFKHKYTVGVLSFAEYNFDLEYKDKIMKAFEATIFPGLKEDQYNILWIEHTDKERLELNFVIPKVELSTGRAFNPYYDPIDRDRVNTFKDYVNAMYYLEDPNDPANRRTVTTRLDLPIRKKESVAELTDYLTDEIKNGNIIDRDGVIYTLTNDLGLDIARITPNFISIKDPDGGRNIRLKGGIYAENFNFSTDCATEESRAEQEYRDTRIERAEQLRSKLKQLIGAKAQFNRERYKPKPIRDTAQVGERHQPNLPTFVYENSNNREYGQEIGRLTARNEAESKPTGAEHRETGRAEPALHGTARNETESDLRYDRQQFGRIQGHSRQEAELSQSDSITNNTIHSNVSSTNGAKSIHGLAVKSKAKRTKPIKRANPFTYPKLELMNLSNQIRSKIFEREEIEAREKLEQHKKAKAQELDKRKAEQREQDARAKAQRDAYIAEKKHIASIEEKVDRFAETYRRNAQLLREKEEFEQMLEESGYFKEADRRATVAKREAVIKNVLIGAAVGPALKFKSMRDLMKAAQEKAKKRDPEIVTEAMKRSRKSAKDWYDFMQNEYLTDERLKVEFGSPHEPQDFTAQINEEIRVGLYSGAIENHPLTQISELIARAKNTVHAIEAEEKTFPKVDLKKRFNLQLKRYSEILDPKSSNNPAKAKTSDDNKMRVVRMQRIKAFQELHKELNKLGEKHKKHSERQYVDKITEIGYSLSNAYLANKRLLPQQQVLSTNSNQYRPKF